MAKNKGFLGLVGFITVGGGPLFLCFFNAADKGAIEKKIVLSGKSREFP